MRDYFTYNGTDSTDFGCVIEHRTNYIAPQKVVERFNVRGRSGDLIIDTGAYSNVVLPYDVFVPHNQVSAFVNWLKSQVGYLRLEDTYDPTVFRKAMYEDELTADNIMAQFGQATIEFNAKPQRYLKEGETPIEIANSGDTLINEWEVALPLIVIEGTGDITFAINNNTLSIADLEDTITLDAETQNCYKGALNLNNTIEIINTEGVEEEQIGTLALDPLTGELVVTYVESTPAVMYYVDDAGNLIFATNLNTQVSLGTTKKFPVLEKGENTIAWTGNVTSVTITPRWWKL